MSYLGDRALWYAATPGWAVFPITPRGKVPLTSRGFQDASKDAATIAEWWRRWPEANIGVACGSVSGIFVVDLDGEEGIGSWMDLANEHADDCPRTLTSATGGGGLHLIFSASEQTRNSASKIGPKVDTRGDGGYIVAPPSIHPSGEAYRWARLLVPAPCPTWILDALRPKPEPVYAPASRAPRGLDPTTAYGRAAMRNILERMTATAEGGRNDALNAAAFSVGQLVAGNELGEEYAREELTHAAREMGLTRAEVEATIASGTRSGKAEPRSAPRRDAPSAPPVTSPGIHAPRNYAPRMTPLGRKAS